MDLGLLAEGLFGIGAGQGPGGVDPVARVHRVDPGAHGFHHPGGVGARGVGQGRGCGVGAGPDVGLHRVDPHGVNLDKHLAGTELGLRHLFQPHHFRRPEFVDANGFHGFPF